MNVRKKTETTEDMSYEPQKNIQSSRLGDLLAETGHLDRISYRTCAGYHDNGGYNAHRPYRRISLELSHYRGAAHAVGNVRRRNMDHGYIWSFGA